jgi:hypothetical protein
MPGPPVLREDDLPVLHGAMRAVRRKDFVSTPQYFAGAASADILGVVLAATRAQTL